MSNSKTRAEIERLVECLDDVPETDVEARNAVERLGIDVGTWAAAIRAKVGVAEAANRRARFAEAEAGHVAETRRLAARRSEPLRSVDELRYEVRALVAQAPRERVVSMHFHKFEEATAAELAEMLRSLRHLLDEDDET